MVRWQKQAKGCWNSNKLITCSFRLCNQRFACIIVKPFVLPFSIVTIVPRTYINLHISCMYPSVCPNELTGQMMQYIASFLFVKTRFPNSDPNHQSRSQDLVGPFRYSVSLGLRPRSLYSFSSTCFLICSLSSDVCSAHSAHVTCHLSCRECNLSSAQQD
jgi:hypothetical protein